MNQNTVYDTGYPSSVMVPLAWNKSCYLWKDKYIHTWCAILESFML
jgi:hypothetical protein